VKSTDRSAKRNGVSRYAQLRFSTTAATTSSAIFPSSPLVTTWKATSTSVRARASSDSPSGAPPGVPPPDGTDSAGAPGASVEPGGFRRELCELRRAFTHSAVSRSTSGTPQPGTP
jgi:hypothetical protein